MSGRDLYIIGWCEDIDIFEEGDHKINEDILVEKVIQGHFWVSDWGAQDNSEESIAKYEHEGMWLKGPWFHEPGNIRLEFGQSEVENIAKGFGGEGASTR